MSRRWWDQREIDWETAKARGAEMGSEAELDAVVQVQKEMEEREDESSTSSGVSGSSGEEWRGASVDIWE